MGEQVLRRHVRGRLVGESRLCRLGDRLVGVNEFNKLEKKAKDVDVIERDYYLFSKNGFSKELMALEKERNDLKLISFSEMVSDSFVKPKKIGFFFSKK